MVGANSPAERVIWRRVGGRPLEALDTLRVYGWTVLSGGVLMILASVFSALLLSEVLPRVAPGYEMFAEYYRYRRLANLTYMMPGVAGAILLPLGLLGMRRFVSHRPGRETLLGVGISVALLSAVLSLVMTVSEFMPRYSFEPLELTPLQTYQGISAVGWSVGISLAGIAALGVRSLGAYRSLPLLLGLAGIPPERLFVFLDFPLGPLLMIDINLPMATLIETPRAISGVGWVIVGILLTGAKRREYEIRTSESLGVVSRFYEEVWVLGNLDAADEMLAPEFVDRRHGLRGSKAFQSFVADLRSTFPDMEFDVLEMTADGDRVQTRWQISGTDEGGLLYYPPTGRRVTFTGTATDLVSRGAIVEHRGSTDEASLREQLGLESPTARRSDAGRRPGGL